MWSSWARLKTHRDDRSTGEHLHSLLQLGLARLQKVGLCLTLLVQQ